MNHRLIGDNRPDHDTTGAVMNPLGREPAHQGF